MGRQRKPPSLSATYFDPSAQPMRPFAGRLSAWLTKPFRRQAAEGACEGMRKGACASRACHVAVQLQAAEQHGRRMEQAFTQFVSPQVIERLMADPDGLSLGGQTRDVTVLFADVRGFTGIAEAMKDDPRRLGDVITAILDPLTDIVLAHGGTLDKYMGDCIMAFWGAPADDPDHARHAVEAGRAMAAAMDDLNARLLTAFGADLPRIDIGVGINSGACIVGNLGSHRRFDYSVLGDPVNVASRLEGLCRTYEASLMVGEETARRLGPGAGLVEFDRVVLRGRAEAQAVYGLA